ncbi:MAG: hypothetical protein RL653_600 [Pseudomonadota bacterium]|jgi:polyisoprenoid-binding protein YceI
MAPVPWQVDVARSHVRFTVRHMVVSKTRGHFARWRAQLLLDDEAPERSRVEVEVELASVDTGDAARDENLRSELFDVARHPLMTFHSTHVVPGGRDRFVLVGELGLHGVSRELRLDCREERRDADAQGRPRRHYAARATVDRKDFGLRWNPALEAGGVLVGDAVEVEVELQGVLPG